MSLQTINIGTTPGDGTGDPARTAFGKINTTVSTCLPGNVIEGVALVGYGNSYLAAVQPITGKRYFDRLASRLQSRASINYGINGGLMQDIVRGALSGYSCTVPYYATSPLNYAFGPYTASGPITYGPGWIGGVILDPTRNDAGLDGQTSNGGTTTKSRNGYRYGLDGMIRLARCASIIDDRASACVYAGSWVQETGINYYVGTLTHTVTNGASVTITTPAGTDFDLISYSLDDAYVGSGTACSTYSVTVDGVAFSTGTTDGLYRYVGSNPTYAGMGAGGAGIVAIPVRGLSNAVHTIKLTHTGTTGQYLYFDCVLVASPTPPLIIIPKLAYLTTGGYNAYIGLGGLNAGTAVDDVYNGIIDSVVGQFPSDGTILTWNPNTAGFNSATMLHSDGVHPNDIGMGFYADGLMPMLNALPARQGLNVL